MDHPAQEAETRQRVVQPTIGGSVYVKPQEIEWEPTQFEGVSIKVHVRSSRASRSKCTL
jgi:hypothetical protein